MAEKSHGSDDTFSEKMSQMSHLADATIKLDDGSTFKVFRLLLALGSEVRSVLLFFGIQNPMSGKDSHQVFSVSVFQQTLRLPQGPARISPQGICIKRGNGADFELGEFTHNQLESRQHLRCTEDCQLLVLRRSDGPV